MYYPDLENYYMYDDNYSNMFNIGWLDKSYDFTKGEVSQNLVEKLRYLTLLAREQDMFHYTHPSGIVVHSGLVRGPIFECPYCGEKIGLFDENDQSDNPKGVQLGLNTMEIPSIDGNFIYIFPTLLYHYITEHNYRPPNEFLLALEAFDLTKPFNCNDLDDNVYESFGE
ncbi:hypothetical protein [Psychrobacter sp. M13]|uniref:DUF7919 family protein n=1 Tax=Psychrobacter sp. M13 TaxID=3067275 RepID=UPI00273ACCCB|nr:hypothetical protein [Psychrobacter sp. M13]WLP95287.1 hypothetical protein Q9G97_04050 [Psychrobacter sp. M13]